MFNFDTTAQNFRNHKVSAFSSAFPVLHKYSTFDKTVDHAYQHDLSPAFPLGDDHDLQEISRLKSLIGGDSGSCWGGWLWYLVVPKDLGDLSKGFFPLPKLWEKDAELTSELEQVKLRIETALDL